jgi:citrate lyase subunit beta/citryl-CoA lyase
VGKWCIHPNQIPIANEVFAPSDEEIAFARKQVEAYEAATKSGEGASSAGGMLVDAASLRLFQAVLDRARQTGRLE